MCNVNFPDFYNSVAGEKPCNRCGYIHIPSDMCPADRAMKLFKDMEAGKTNADKSTLIFGGGRCLA